MLANGAQSLRRVQAESTERASNWLQVNIKRRWARAHIACRAPCLQGVAAVLRRLQRQFLVLCLLGRALNFTKSASVCVCSG